MHSFLRRTGLPRAHRGPFLRYRHGGRTRNIQFLILAFTLCVLAALLALGIKILVEGVASTELKRYQPVDVPPEEIAPDRTRDREVLKEQGRWIDPKAPSTERATERATDQGK